MERGLVGPYIDICWLFDFILHISTFDTLLFFLNFFSICQTLILFFISFMDVNVVNIY